MNEPAPFPEGLSESERTFIRQHLHDHVPDLMLQGSRYPEVDIRKMAGQIAARQKARYKLPTWYANEHLHFPPPLSVEQGSSEATARFKASLVAGQRLIDCTGGMGVDCYYMSQRFDRTLYIEQQPEVAQTAAYNLRQLGAASRIDVRTGDALRMLADGDESADWIYADPARRDDRQQKVAQLTDCTPDMTLALPTLFRIAPRILIKTAPLLDIDRAVSQLGSVQEVHVTGLDSECKEVLYVLHEQAVWTQQSPIRVSLLLPDGQVQHVFAFSRLEEATATPPLSPPLAWLYEPHAAVLKAGAFKSLAVRYGVSKLATHTHLYTSEKPVADFPGRTFRIVALCKPDARALAAYAPDGKANLTVRNFPGRTDDLRKKWRLKDGGDMYFFATELQDKQKIVIVTQKAYLD